MTNPSADSATDLHARFPAGKSRFALRITLLSLTGVTTVGATAVFLRILEPHGDHPLHIPLVALFALLLAWVAFGAWTGIVGVAQLLRDDPAASRRATPLGPHMAGPNPPTAVVVPIYHEAPDRVFASVQAMHEDLDAHDGRGPIDFYILSDSTHPDAWAREQLAYTRLLQRLGDDARVYYRRRAKNVHRKAGNLADFCKRFGGRYEFMLVLDADSVVAAPTLLEMIRRMRAQPRLGILQAPPKPVNRGSVFARMQQFAASVYGEVFSTGFSVWTQADGNYFGHNALIRVEPFTRHCGLPVLPGRPPLGGEILSHDFVEAALIRRAGYAVRVDPDLDGSYEECPTSVDDFAKRDQRWCQGNLQHGRIVLAGGLHPISRLHLAMGIMSYLSSPLWGVFLLLGGIAAATGGLGSPSPTPESLPSGAPIVPDWAYGLGLFVFVMGLITAPRALAFALLLRDPNKLAAHGGEAKAAGSVALELALSSLLAPVLMLFHSLFVLTTLAGHNIKWEAQNRDESALTALEAIRTYRWHTVVGLAATAAAYRFAPDLLPWLSPVLLGLVGSAPLAMLLSSARLGRALQERGYLLIPEEHEPPAILVRQNRIAQQNEADTAASDAHPLLRLVATPPALALHAGLTRAHIPPPGAEARLDRVAQIFLHGGADYLKKDDRTALLSSPDTLWALHQRLWNDWEPGELEAATARAPAVAATV
ncbi:MAG: glucans biosynthesis glucosyltransferase MdoH [Planctomycetota bacterium]